MRHQLACAALLVGACHPGQPALRIATGRDVPTATAPPAITSVRDLDTPRLPPDGNIPAGIGDGVAVVGELVLVSGRDFGRRTRVTVDGQAAAQLARTTDGAVVIRVPWGVRPGKRPIEVINAHGANRATYSIRRYALATIPSRDQVVPLLIGRTAVLRVATPLMVPNARFVRFSAHGQVALVTGTTAADEPIVSLLDMVASGGPRRIRTQRVPGKRIVALAAAARASRACVISDTQLLFFDLHNPIDPAVYRPIPLPRQLVGRVISADMGPNGSLLAILVRNNIVQLYDVSRPEAMQLIASTPVLPGMKVPLVRDMQFGIDPNTIWVISGDNARSARAGRFPLRLTAIRIRQRELRHGHSFGLLSVWRTLDVPHRAAPVALAVASGQPLATGQTIRMPPKTAAVFITAHDSKLLRLRNARFDRRRGLRRAVQILKGIAPLGTVVRTDIDGRGSAMLTSASLMGAIDITSDSQLLLATGAKVAARRKPPSLRLVYGVSTCRVFGELRPRFIPLAEADPEALARPFLLGDVRIQP